MSISSPYTPNEDHVTLVAEKVLINDNFVTGIAYGMLRPSTSALYSDLPSS